MGSEWVEVALRDLAEGIFDGPHATPERTSSGPVFLGISSLYRGRLDLSKSDHLSEKDFPKWTRRVTPSAGDLVFSYETRLGEAALVPPGLRCCLGRRMGLVRPNRTKVDPRFLLYAYIGPPFQETLRQKTVHGSTVDRILLTELPTFPMLVPKCIDEQRRIAAVLGALDDKIELNRKMNRTLEEMAQAIFKSWFIDFGGAETLRVEELIERGVLAVGDGYRARRAELSDTGVPFARAGNIDDGFHLDEAELLGHDGVLRAREKVSVPFDVVFTSKGTVGRFAFVTPGSPRFAYSPQLCFWRSLNPGVLSSFFLLCWMRSRYFLDQVAAVKGQTDMAEYVSLRDQRRMQIVVPPPDRQAELESRLRPLIARQDLCVRESRTLTTLRDTLLPKLISGEIRVPEADAAVEEAL